MKHIVICIGIFMMCNLPHQLFAQKKKTSSKKELNYQITFNLPGIPDSILFVANYFGEHTYLRDTLRPIKKHPYTFVMEGTDTLKRGVYILASQNNTKYFEFLVDSSFFFSVKSDTLDPEHLNVSNHIKFENSPENNLFYQFTSYMIGQQITGSSISKKMKEEQSKSTPNQELMSNYRMQMGAVYDSMQTYTNRFIKEHPSNIFAKAQKLGQDVDIPEIKPENYPDSNWQYQYYFEHYWDNCDFTDDALVYTPVFHPRLVRYYDKIIHPSVDSLIKYTDILIEKAKESPEMFKYIVWFVSNRFETSKFIGQDAIFVHLIRTYYQKGLCPWIDTTVLENMIHRADILEPILIGKKAPWLVMPDINGDFHHNYEFNNVDFTIMYFWDTDCGHCKVTTPKLLEFYNRAKDSLHFEVFGVCLTADSIKWKNYIIEKQLPWINVGNNKANIDFREIYDITASPRFYILDKNKNIIVKNIEFELIEEFLSKYRNGEIKY